MNLSFVKLFSKRPARAPRVPHAVSARRMLGAAVLAVWALAAVPAHAQDPSPDSDDNSVTLPDPLGPASAEDQKALPGVPLSSQIVFQVLAAEVALQRDQPAPAYQTYLALARDTHDPRMAQRATEIALAAQSPSDALAAAQLWQQYAPDSERAAQLDASLLVLSGKPDDAGADPRPRTRESAGGESRQRDSRVAVAAVARPEPDRRLARAAGSAARTT